LRREAAREGSVKSARRSGRRRKRTCQEAVKALSERRKSNEAFRKRIMAVEDPAEGFAGSVGAA